MNAEQHYKMGEVESEKGNYEVALENFNLAISINPNYSKAYGHRGFVRFIMGDITGALEDCYRALAINPQEQVHLQI
jgi:tetratricopeptide (TPR) repeat protein